MSPDQVDTATYLAHVVAVVREHGYVRASDGQKQPTWQAALARLRRGTKLSAADLHRAHEVIGWAASLQPRDPDGYRSRMAECLAHERLAPHQLSLAASAVRTFNVHLYYEIRGRKSRAQAAA